MKQLAKMLALVATKFENKFDKGGKPYFLHCMRVMNQMPPDDEELMCIAVGHDLFEDTDLKPLDLLHMGFTDKVVEAIVVLTHRKDESYDNYIRRISTNENCTRVKLADLKDNSDVSRIKGLTKADFERIEKYHKSYVYLSKI